MRYPKLRERIAEDVIPDEIIVRTPRARITYGGRSPVGAVEAIVLVAVAVYFSLCALAIFIN